MYYHATAKNLIRSLMHMCEGRIHFLSPPAKIVCGCDNQEVLSEVVEKWILEHDQVANSSKVDQLVQK